jgi:hypothetical protein
VVVAGLDWAGSFALLGILLLKLPKDSYFCGSVGVDSGLVTGALGVPRVKVGGPSFFEFVNFGGPDAYLVSSVLAIIVDLWNPVS